MGRERPVLHFLPPVAHQDLQVGGIHDAVAEGVRPDVARRILLTPGLDQPHKVVDIHDAVAVEVHAGQRTKNSQAATIGPNPRASLAVGGKTGRGDMWKPGVPLVEHPPVFSIESCYPTGCGVRTTHPHP